MLHTWLLKLGVHLLRKPRFRKWAELEDKKYDVIKAVEQGSDSLHLSVYDYVSTALILHPKNFSKVYWKDVIDAFLDIHRVTVPEASLPLTSRHSEHKDEKDPWDYSGRLWYFYSNIIAAAYGWTVTQIANLSVREALAYIQEILTDNQVQREDTWMMSEIAYPYNKATKKSKFSPLPRPYWMLPDKDTNKRKAPAIPKSLLPVGNIIRLDAPKNTRPL